MLSSNVLKNKKTNFLIPMALLHSKKTENSYVIEEKKSFVGLEKSFDSQPPMSVKILATTIFESEDNFI